MLLFWQKRVFDYVPEKIDGYTFICTIPIFIPFRRINLSVLERTTQKVSFIHTCVLQAVNITTMTIDSLAALFCIDKDIIIEIVATLDEAKMVFIVAGHISISEIGRQVLEKEAMTKVTKARITDLYFNQITGEISEDKPIEIYDFPRRGQVYLDEEYPATLAYFQQHQELVAQIYRNNSVHELFFHDSNQSTDLYRITDIEDQHLCYYKVLCQVFISIHDNSLMLHLPQNSDVYASAVKKQLDRRATGVDKLFSHSRTDFKNCGTTDSYPILESMREITTCSIPKEERIIRMEKLYFSKRTILDGEIDDIFSHIGDVHAKKLLIESWDLSHFDITSLLSAAKAPSVTEFIIITNVENNYQKKKIEQIRKEICAKNGKFTLRVCSQQKRICILVGDYCFIEGTICCSNTIYHRSIFSFHGTIIFEQGKINHIWNQYRS